MRWHIRYENTIMFSGTLQEITKIFSQTYKKFSYYEIVSDQMLREESWDKNGTD